MTDARDVIERVESAIVAQLRARVLYLAGEDRSTGLLRCRGVAQSPTMLDYSVEIAPSALVQYRGAAERPLKAPIGRPLQTELTFIWWIHLLALSFGVSGEGRLDGTLAGEPGSYRQVGDTYRALAGFLVDPGNTDACLEYGGDEFSQIVNGRIVYLSKWRHRARRTGVIV